MNNQKAISARIDEGLLNMAKDHATLNFITLNRLLNRALEHYLLYYQYRNTAVPKMMTFEEYYRRKEKHARRPPRWEW